MSAHYRPSLFAMIGCLVFWGATAFLGSQAEAGCVPMSKMRSCQESPAARDEGKRNEVTMIPSPADWDTPIHTIYLSHLAPLFAACDCPFYGVEETESWNDPDRPGLRWWQITVVLGVMSNGSWELRSREYLFSAKDADPPQLAKLGPESAWPVTPAVSH